MTGDDLTCREAAGLNPGILTAEVKKSVGMESALCLSAPRAHELIRERAREAIERIGSIEPVRPRGPFELRLHFTETERARSEVARRGGRLDADQLTVIRASDEYLDVAM